MKVNSIWVPVVAALALAAPAFAGRSERDDPTTLQASDTDSQAGRFAAQSTSTSDTVAQPAAAPVEAAQVTPPPATTPETTPAPVEEQTPASTTAAAPASEPAATPPMPAAHAEAPAELPKTASPLALLALMGLGSAGSALGLRFTRRK